MGSAVNVLNGGMGNSDTEGVGTNIDAAELLAVRNERGSSDFSELERSTSWSSSVVASKSDATIPASG